MRIKVNVTVFKWANQICYCVQWTATQLDVEKSFSVCIPWNAPANRFCMGSWLYHVLILLAAAWLTLLNAVWGLFSGQLACFGIWGKLRPTVKHFWIEVGKKDEWDLKLKLWVFTQSPQNKNHKFSCFFQGSWVQVSFGFLPSLRNVWRTNGQTMNETFMSLVSSTVCESLTVSLPSPGRPERTGQWPGKTCPPGRWWRDTAWEHSPDWGTATAPTWRSSPGGRPRSATIQS